MRKLAASLLLLMVGSACGGAVTLPPPRPLVVSSGARLTPDPERLQEIHDWLVPQDDFIREDPTFWIVPLASEQDTYPWETLVLAGSPPADSARYQHTRTNPDIITPYNIYAHLHLMHRRGPAALEPWLPEAFREQGFALERAIVARMADSWLLGRASFDAQPHQLMDELIYAKEAGHLDAFLFTARPEEFQEARETWVRQNPQGLEQYRAWFRQTLGGDPPGIRAGRQSRSAGTRG